MLPAIAGCSAVHFVRRPQAPSLFGLLSKPHKVGCYIAGKHSAGFAFLLGELRLSGADLGLDEAAGVGVEVGFYAALLHDVEELL